MSVPTLAATRAYIGQSKGKTGEEVVLSFEEFPNTGISKVSDAHIIRQLTLILRRSRTGTVWFYTSTSNKRAARPKLYTKSLTRDLKLMYYRLPLVRISINL